MDGSTGRRRPPVIMGHEAAGVIEKLGPAVSDWNTGDRVTFDSTIYCGDCVYCRRGEVNLCDRRKVLGVSCEDYRQNGAFAEFVIVPQRILYRLPAGLSFEHGALVEPYAIAVHAVRRSPPALNDSVVVVGAGMIGLALTQALRHAGCGQLIVVDVSNERLELAKRCGATQVLNSAKEDALARINQCTGGKGADIAFEAVGVSPTVDLSLRCLRKGGAATLVGNITPIIDFPLQIAVTRELTILGSCASKGSTRRAWTCSPEAPWNLSRSISATDRLSAGAAWFQRLEQQRTRAAEGRACAPNVADSLNAGYEREAVRSERQSGDRHRNQPRLGAVLGPGAGSGRGGPGDHQPDPQRLQPFQEEIESPGPESAAASAGCARVRQHSEHGRTPRMAHYGKIDILVNNAGCNVRKPALDVTWEDWNLVLDTNLRGTFFVAQAVARHMVPRKYGRIINIGSVTCVAGYAGSRPLRRQSGGVKQLTMSLADDWGIHGITVNCLAPGWFKTAQNAVMYENKEWVDYLCDRIPLKRPGQPRTWMAPWCSWLPTPANTSPARPCWWMAAFPPARPGPFR